MAFHDLTKKQIIYKKTKNILGLGTKFKQIRIHAHLPQLQDKQPKLYCKSNFKPPKADSYTEARIIEFL